MLKSFNDHVLKLMDPKAAEKRDKAPSSSAPSKPSALLQVDGEAKRVKPIIIVPQALTSVITAHNALDFFAGAFVTTEERRKQGGPIDVEQKYLRKIDGGHRPIEYRIVDNPLLLGEKEWDSVAAVFVTGQLWQFKDWNDKKWANPSNLFSEVLGVHLMMSDSPVNPKVQEWNTTVSF